ncbi:S8 family serine peptidase [Syntrophomonas erecta subsp. sporosyntropha]
MNALHKWCVKSLAVLLVGLIIWGANFTYLLPDNISLAGQTELLNDRAADIINARPLSAENFILTEGLSGAGQMVGLADTGLDRGSLTDLHPDLQNEPDGKPRVISLKSYTDRDLPDDPHGHGTHMAATIVGSGKASNGEYRGIAPGASLYFQALLDSRGNFAVPYRISDLFAPAHANGVRVHVNGWGTNGNQYSATTAEIDEFIYKHPEFLAIFGAGNSGPAAGSLSNEANSKNALVVGSSQIPRPALSLESRYADQLASTSSQGPTRDGRIKPDLVAPGSAVISACSRLTESNFTPNEKYTRMGGTSMAAAVSGGAAAVLRQYLEQKGETTPSSALIKALLINGARRSGGEYSGAGFGIIDLAGTILALQEGSFGMIDSVVQQDKEDFYFYKVMDNNSPFKATLVWTDPAASSGAEDTLVNDLDLVVEAPDGTIYRGNDFNNRGTSDQVNNTEQVYIPAPLPGNYRITVKGAGLQEGFTHQKFALVMGQPLTEKEVASGRNSQIYTHDGQKISTDKAVLYDVRDGKKETGSEVSPGSIAYIGSKSIYLFGRTWNSGGVQLLPTPGGDLVMEMNPSYRDGGFYLDPGYEPGEIVKVNKRELNQIEEFPVGAPVEAVVDPLRQTLTRVNVDYEEIEARLLSFDLERRTITLINDRKAYHLAPWATGNFVDKMVDCSQQEAAYGYAENVELEKLVPGMKVSLLITPKTRIVHYVKAERQLVVGRVNSVEEDNTIKLDTGVVYKIIPDSTIINKDGQKADLKDIKPNDVLTGFLLSDTDSFLQVNVNSTVNYGRILYFNNREKTLHLLTTDNHFVQYQVNSEAETYRHGVAFDTALLAPGSWVRVTGSPLDGNVRRIDVADSYGKTIKRLEYYDANTKLLHMTDGSVYRYFPSTLVTKDGYWLMPEDLLPGEKLSLTLLSAPVPYDNYLAAAEVDSPWKPEPPVLKAEAYVLNGVLIIQGSTTANRVVLYRQDGSRKLLPVDETGQFSTLTRPLEDESSLEVVAISSANKGIAGQEINLKPYPEKTGNIELNDITGHPAQADIQQLFNRGIVHGYDDGTYRPGQPVTRLEFVQMIAAETNGSTNIWPPAVPFQDTAAIPIWSLNSIDKLRQRGILQGYPDGTLRPFQYITRAEVAVILDRTFIWPDANQAGNPLLPSEVSWPLWAGPAISRSYGQGLFPWSDLMADRPVSRAEAAQILSRVYAVFNPN